MTPQNRLIWAYLSMDTTEVGVVDYLRAALKQRAVKLTTVSTETCIPYRSLQNYFAKKSEMPISVYLKICTVACIPLDWPLQGNRAKIDTHILRQALIDVCGALLPTIEEEDTWALSLRPREKVSAATIRKDAGVIAALIESRYDMEMQRSLSEPRRGQVVKPSPIDHNPETSPIGEVCKTCKNKHLAEAPKSADLRQSRCSLAKPHIE